MWAIVKLTSDGWRTIERFDDYSEGQKRYWSLVKEIGSHYLKFVWDGK